MILYEMSKKGRSMVTEDISVVAGAGGEDED